MSESVSGAVPGLPMPPTPPARIEALHTASRVAVTGLGITIGLNVIDVVLTALVSSSAERPVGDPLALAQLGVVVLYVVVVLGTAAAFMTWLYIARKNLVTWRSGVGWAPGWAIGAWFIPLANLVLPVLVVNAVARGSENPTDPRSVGPSRAGLVGAWWAAFVLSGCCQNAAARQELRGIQDSTAATFNVLGSLGYILAAILAIMIVRRVTRQQEHRQATLDAGWQQMLMPPPPPPSASGAE